MLAAGSAIFTVRTCSRLAETISSAALHFCPRRNSSIIVRPISTGCPCAHLRLWNYRPDFVARRAVGGHHAMHGLCRQRQIVQCGHQRRIPPAIQNLLQHHAQRIRIARTLGDLHYVGTFRPHHRSQRLCICSDCDQHHLRIGIQRVDQLTYTFCMWSSLALLQLQPASRTPVLLRKRRDCAYAKGSRSRAS